MNRSLYCRACGEASIKRGLHPEDRKMGWSVRLCYVCGMTPHDHRLYFITESSTTCTPLETIMCDQCGEPIQGTICVARTMWRKNHEPEPDCWENEYGRVLTAEEVKAADIMKGQQNER